MNAENGNATEQNVKDEYYSITLYERENEHFSISITKQFVRSQDGSCIPRRTSILLDGYYKVPGGIRSLIQRYASFNLEQCLDDLIMKGEFSKRPYQLGQASDGTDGSCVIALYYDFCQKQNYSPIALMKQAYPHRVCWSREDFESAIQFAEWQGVAYPKQWNQEAIEGLIESLTQVNYHSLVKVLTELTNLNS